MNTLDITYVRYVGRRRIRRIKRFFKPADREKFTERFTTFCALFCVAVVIVVSVVNFDQPTTEVIFREKATDLSKQVFTLNITDAAYNKSNKTAKDSISTDSDLVLPVRTRDNLDEDTSISDEDPLSHYYSQGLLGETENATKTEEHLPVTTAINYSSGDQVLELSRLDFALLCHFVLHEAGQPGISNSYYLGSPDIDFLQQCIAATVINTVKSKRFSETSVEEVLLNSGHLGALGITTHEQLIKYLFKVKSLDELESYLNDFEFNDQSALTQNALCTITKKNVRLLLSGDVVLDPDVIFEMGWQMYDDNGNLITDLNVIQQTMERHCGRVEIIYSCVTVEDFVCTIARKIW